MILTLNFKGFFNNIGVISKSLPFIGGETWNAILSFEIINNSEDLIIDEVTGNLIPAPATITKVEISAKLYQMKRPANTIYYSNDGTNFNRIYFEGYLVRPLQYNIPYERQSIGMEAEINGIKGLFYPILELKYYEAYQSSIDRSLGQAISGFFEILNS